MISQEGLAALARLVRAMPRNPDLMILNEAVNASVANTANRLANAANKRDRKDYMRDYMRKKRAARKTSI